MSKPSEEEQRNYDESLRREAEEEQKAHDELDAAYWSFAACLRREKMEDSI